MSASKAERIAGGIVGLLIGDALGVPYEFHAAAEIPCFSEIEFDAPVWFRRSHSTVPAGTWSDDGAQALVLLDSLLTCGKFDAAHFAENLIAWQDEGLMAVDNHVFDVRIQTNKAIRQLKQGVALLAAGGRDEHSNGNGSLMRVLPLALWHTGNDCKLVADAFDSSAVTHGHLRARLCCAIYCLWARRILQEVENSFANAVATMRAMFGENTAERKELEFQIRPDALREATGSGYVVDSLFSAQWANRSGENDYEKVVKAAVSLGRDTDTTACVAGGIAGLKVGINAIPQRWREDLRGREIYQPLINSLLDKVAG